MNCILLHSLSCFGLSGTLFDLPKTRGHQPFYDLCHIIISQKNQNQCRYQKNQQNILWNGPMAKGCPAHQKSVQQINGKRVFSDRRYQRYFFTHSVFEPPKQTYPHKGCADQQQSQKSICPHAVAPRTVDHSVGNAGKKCNADR